MPWFKSNPVFYTLLSFLIAGVLAGMWFAAQRRAVLVELQDRYKQKSTQLDFLMARVPSPTRGNLEALESNYEDLYEVYEDVLRGLNMNTYDPAVFFGTDPQSKTDAFFEIAHYVEGARRLAAASGVAIGRQERFGFGKYTNVGPVKEEIPIVHRQVVVMRFILGELFASKIDDFVGVQREEPVEGKSTRSASASRNSLRGDIFELERRESVRADEELDSLAFRVTFKSKSISMRQFINRVVESNLPFVICSVHVEAADGKEAGYERSQIADNPFSNPSGGDQLIQAAQIPIITENESTFSITLEFIEPTRAFEAPHSSERESDA